MNKNLEDLSTHQIYLLEYMTELIGDAYAKPENKELRPKIIHGLESLFTEFELFRDYIVEYSDAITDLMVMHPDVMRKWDHLHANGMQLMLLIHFMHHPKAWDVKNAFFLFRFDTGEPISLITHKKAS